MTDGYEYTACICAFFLYCKVQEEGEAIRQRAHTRSSASALPKELVFSSPSWSSDTERYMRIATNRKNAARPAMPMWPVTTVAHQIGFASCGDSKATFRDRA